MSVVDSICYENGECIYDVIGEFLKENKDFLERVVSVYEGILEDMIEQKFLEEFEAFVIQKNKL